jgi:hypothetical protein
MMFRRSLLAQCTVALLVFVSGCGYDVPKPGTEVQIEGKVVAGNLQSFTGMTIFLQATGGEARQAQFQLSEAGKFKGTVIAGKYTYFLGTKAGGTDTLIPGIPEKFQKGSLDRQVDIGTGGGEIEFKF